MDMRSIRQQQHTQKLTKFDCEHFRRFFSALRDVVVDGDDGGFFAHSVF